MAKKKHKGGLAYSPDGHVVGKTIYRIRQRHIADHLSPLITARRIGAVKLDLVLRGLAFREQDLGARQAEPGLILNRYRYEDLHDLCRPHTIFRGNRTVTSIGLSKEIEQKSEWVRSQLKVLEGESLVERIPNPRGTGRPTVYVRSDIGDGTLFDDPTGIRDDDHDDRYITLHGGVIACGAFAGWNTREVVGYLSALVAERYDYGREEAEAGSGNWWRPPEWFSDPDGPQIPFSPTTVKRGIGSLVEQGWIHSEPTSRHPRTKRRLRYRRNYYTNRFVEQAAISKEFEISLEEFIREELSATS